MVTNGREIGTMEQYFSVVFFWCNTTGIMLSPILNNGEVNIPKYAPMGSHKTTTQQKPESGPRAVQRAGRNVYSLLLLQGQELEAFCVFHSDSP